MHSKSCYSTTQLLGKSLKSVKDLLVFEQMQVFTYAFLSLMSNGINQNHSDFSRERKPYERNIREVFVSKETDGRLEDLKSKGRTLEINSELQESLDDLGGSGKNTKIIEPNYLFSELLEQDDEEYSNIELARPRTTKEKSTPIVEPKPYINPLTRLEIESSGAHSFYEFDEKRRPDLVIREKYNRRIGRRKTKRRARWSWGRVTIYIWCDYICKIFTT